MEFCIQFATQLILNEMKKNVSSAKNVVMSPLSINLMLNMLAAGAEGKTLEQLLKFLGSEGIQDLNQKSSVMVSLLHSSVSKASTPSPLPTTQNQTNRQNTEEQQPLFSVANALWVDNRIHLIPSFKEITETIYNAKVENVDLTLEGDKVREDVNIWVEKEIEFSFGRQKIMVFCTQSKQTPNQVSPIRLGPHARPFHSMSEVAKGVFLLDLRWAIGDGELGWPWEMVIWVTLSSADSQKQLRSVEIF
ncbi:hypothetical protein G4B88_013682 [Cannabis sativa]|uniref:Serpin domain-containing protein n=1 Tax=Cannabis sativa TaxID=3483 RepID=A0A7J6HTG0_CANSA|nr:hypothetical protein G4B88_013682 [Cannabis sativa]